MPVVPRVLLSAAVQRSSQSSRTEVLCRIRIRERRSPSGCAGVWRRTQEGRQPGRESERRYAGHGQRAAGPATAGGHGCRAAGKPAAHVDRTKHRLPAAGPSSRPRPTPASSYVSPSGSDANTRPEPELAGRSLGRAAHALRRQLRRPDAAGPRRRLERVPRLWKTSGAQRHRAHASSAPTARAPARSSTPAPSPASSPAGRANPAARRPPGHLLPLRRPGPRSPDLQRHHPRRRHRDRGQPRQHHHRGLQGRLLPQQHGDPVLLRTGHQRHHPPLGHRRLLQRRRAHSQGIYFAEGVRHPAGGERLRPQRLERRPQAGADDLQPQRLRQRRLRRPRRPRQRVRQRLQPRAPGPRRAGWSRTTCSSTTRSTCPTAW